MSDENPKPQMAVVMSKQTFGFLVSIALMFIAGLSAFMWSGHEGQQEIKTDLEVIKSRLEESVVYRLNRLEKRIDKLENTP